MWQIIKGTCKITVLKFDSLISVRRFWSFHRKAKLKVQRLIRASRVLPVRLQFTSMPQSGGERTRTPADFSAVPTS